MPEEHEAISEVEHMSTKDYNWDLATKIYEELFRKGAGIGNASIPIISKVLDQQIKKLSIEFGYEKANLEAQIADRQKEIERLKGLIKAHEEVLKQLWKQFKTENKL